MKIKIIITVIVNVLIYSNFLFAQSYDKRLLARYSEDKLQKIAKETPGHLEWLNYKVANMYKIIDRKQAKGAIKDTLKKVNTKTKEILKDKITQADLENFNPLLYDISFSKEGHYYYVPGTNKVVYIRPSVEVISEFNKRYRSK